MTAPLSTAATTPPVSPRPVRQTEVTAEVKAAAQSLKARGVSADLVGEHFEFLHAITDTNCPKIVAKRLNGKKIKRSNTVQVQAMLKVLYDINHGSLEAKPRYKSEKINLENAFETYKKMILRKIDCSMQDDVRTQMNEEFHKVLTFYNEKTSEILPEPSLFARLAKMLHSGDTTR